MIIKRRCDIVYEVLKNGNITQVVTRKEFFKKQVEQLRGKNSRRSIEQLKYELIRYCEEEIESQEYVIETSGDLPLDRYIKWQAEEDIDRSDSIKRGV